MTPCSIKIASPARSLFWARSLCWTLALLPACADTPICREYPTWISHVTFASDGGVEVAGLAGDDIIECTVDPGAGGFRARYRDGALSVEPAQVSAHFVDDGWYYSSLRAFDDEEASLENAKSPQYRVDVWHPDSPVTVHIESVFNPEHDLAISFVDADGDVLAETLVE